MAAMLVVYGAFFLFVLGTGLVGHAGLALSPALQSETPWLRSFLALTLGLFVAIAELVALGFLGLFAVGPVMAALSATAGLAALFLWRKGDIPQGFGAPSLVFMLLLFCGVSVSAHPVGLWDDTMYHLPLARHSVEQAGFACTDTLRFPLFPQNMDVLFGLGFLLYGANTVCGEVFVQLLASLPLALAQFGIIAASVRYVGTPCPGLLGAAALLFLKPVMITTGFAYIDSGLMLFCWAALLCLALSLDSSRDRRSLLVLAGLFSGMAIGTKYFGLVSIGISGLLFLCLTRDVRSTLLFGAVALLTGSCWYIRAWLISGDPVHPAGGRYLGYFLWNEQDMLIQTVEQGMHGVEKNLLNIWPALHKAGVGLLAATPLAALRWRAMTPGLRLMFFSSLAYFLFWFFVTQVERYIMPVLPPLLFLVSWSAWGLLLRGKTPSKTLRLILFALFVLALTVACHDRRTTLAGWEQYQYPRDGILLMESANALSPQYGNRLFQLGYENLLYMFHGTAFGDHFGTFRYRDALDGQLMTEKDFSIEAYLAFLKQTPLVQPERMLEILKKQHCRMIAVNTDMFRFDAEAYRPYFETQKVTPHGILLTVKDEGPR